ncbi:MAG: T9SS type A sorting domain-containing protein, partial [Bacteroidales bacterium]|nr:T9SS type A sorting domain-containing protein [Bacteroidales bacterium]
QSQSITLNLSGQPAGIYLVKITDKKGQKCVKKVVKE